MGIDVKRLGREPIVVLTFTEPAGDFDKEFDAACSQVADLMADCPIYYRITDFTRADLTFSTLVVKLARETEGRRGSVTDPQAMPLFVGAHDIVSFAINALTQEQYGNLRVVECATLSQAIAYARTVNQLSAD